MNKLIIIVCLLLTTSANAQDDLLVQWSLIIRNSFGQSVYTISPQGGMIHDNTFTYSCIQNPIHVMKDNTGNLQEEVAITCKVGIVSEVSLVQNCLVNRHNTNSSVLKVRDNLYNYTISLACGN